MNANAPLVVSCSYGEEDPERAILSFIFANVAASADQPAAVLLTIEGVRLATTGYADEIRKDGFPPLREVMDSFRANGGQIWACGTCAKPRGIGESDLIPGARIVTAAFVVQQMVAGAPAIGF